jgi:hypothetical protein
MVVFIATDDNSVFNNLNPVWAGEDTHVSMFG